MFTKICSNPNNNPNCLIQQTYNRIDHWRNAIKKNTLCWSCHNKLKKDNRPIQEIIKSKLTFNFKNNCLECFNSKNKAGYGIIEYNNKQWLLHRLVWALANDKINSMPKKMVIRHICDNPSCCNINHLVLDTQTGNHKDMEIKGRARGGSNKGIKNGNYKHGKYVI